MQLHKLMLAGLVALVTGLVVVPAVLAHTRPVRFDPPPGAVLDAAPATVQGWFSSDIRRESTSFLRVLDAAGQRVDEGATALSADRRQMSVALRTGLAEGRYLVHWSALSDEDGHVSSGCYAFFLGQAAAESAIRGGDPLDGGSRCPAVAEATPTPDEAASSQTNVGEDDGDSGGVPLWALIAGIGVGVVIGGIGGRLLSGRS